MSKWEDNLPPYGISKGTMVQIRYWDKALRQNQKAIRRKNKVINSLQIKNDDLQRQLSRLMIEFSELQNKLFKEELNKEGE